MFWFTFRQLLCDSHSVVLIFFQSLCVWAETQSHLFTCVSVCVYCWCKCRTQLFTLSFPLNKSCFMIHVWVYCPAALCLMALHPLLLISLVTLFIGYLINLLDRMCVALCVLNDKTLCQVALQTLNWSSTKPALISMFYCCLFVIQRTGQTYVYNSSGADENLLQNDHAVWRPHRLVSLTIFVCGTAVCKH